jgi:hypothetical protein
MKLMGGNSNEVLMKQKHYNELEEIFKANMPRSDMPYSQNLINQLCDDNDAMMVARNPSSLVSVPRVNEKYEFNSIKQGAKLAATDLITNIKKGQEVLNFNAAFFGGVSEKAKQPVE